MLVMQTLLVLCCCLETADSSIYLAQISRYHLNVGTESTVRNFVFQIKDMTVDNATIIIVMLLYHRHKYVDIFGDN
jgi:hypothetical protein